MAQWLNVAVALLRQIVAFDVELERAAKGDVEHLKSFANREDRQPTPKRFLHGCEFPAITLPVDVFIQHRRIGDFLSQKFWRNIGPAGQQKPIHLVEANMPISRVPNLDFKMLGKNCAEPFRVFRTYPGSQIWHWANLRLANGHVKSTSMFSVDVSNGLHEELETLALKNKARAIGVALHDLETGFRFSLRGDRWFHAASTIKVAVLLAVFRAADEGLFRLDDSLHVRNRFFSAADGSPFRVSQDRDATPELYATIGRTAKISALAYAMICGSSNLATNLLLDFVSVEYARTVLREARVDGVELRRGVEDHGAHERSINNEATADGLLSLLSAIRGDFLTPESKRQVIRILLEQRFNSMIPAGLPPHATVAHKTGEISTACHDIGIVYLPEREPYIVAILTEFDPDTDGRREMVAAISEAIYRSLLRTESKANED